MLSQVGNPSPPPPPRKKKAMESIARKVYFNNFVFSCTFVLRPACLQSIPDFKNKNQT